MASGGSCLFSGFRQDDNDDEKEKEEEEEEILIIYSHVRSTIKMRITYSIMTLSHFLTFFFKYVFQTMSTGTYAWSAYVMNIVNANVSLTTCASLYKDQKQNFIMLKLSGCVVYVFKNKNLLISKKLTVVLTRLSLAS